MRELAQDDPRSLIRQAWLHDYYCGGGWSSGGVHGSWAFLPWHRAFVYYHERILARLVNNENFRLPVWDWENNSRLPSFFEELGLPTFLTGTSGRLPNPGNWLDPCAIQAWLASERFEDFGGAVNSCQAAGGVHTVVHTRVVGGAMRFPATAAADPIFYAHHGNVDRFWWHWQKQYSFDIPEGFRRQKFHFFDERGAFVEVEASQVLNEADLGYRYDENPPKVPLCQYNRLIVDGKMLAEARLRTNRFMEWQSTVVKQSAYPVQVVATLDFRHIAPGTYYVLGLASPTRVYTLGGFGAFASSGQCQEPAIRRFQVPGRLGSEVLKALLSQTKLLPMCAKYVGHRRILVSNNILSDVSLRVLGLPA